MRLWESINNRTDELMSLDMILMDEKVFFLDYITLHIIYIYESTFLIVTPPNNNTRFGGVTTLQDNKKTKAIDI
jgi:hypothetical protein